MKNKIFKIQQLLALLLIEKLDKQEITLCESQSLANEILKIIPENCDDSSAPEIIAELKKLPVINILFLHNILK